MKIDNKVFLYWGILALIVGLSLTYLKFSEMIGAEKNKTLDFGALFIFVYTFFMGVGLIYNYYKNRET